MARKTPLNPVVILLLCSVPITLNAQDAWKSGQDSPAHDSDRAFSLTDGQIVFENHKLRIAFDKKSGALVDLEEKEKNWRVEGQTGAADSFRMFVPIPGRDYNPVLGARNELSSWRLSPDGQSLSLTWSSLKSEYGGTLDITLLGNVKISNSAISFTATVTNNSPYTVDTVSWPILGGLRPPNGENSLKREDIRWATLIRALIVPEMANEFGYWGTNWPTSVVGSRFVLVSGSNQGFYIGNHDITQQEVVTYMFQLQPGYLETFLSLGPSGKEISGHRVRTSMEAIHYAYVRSGQSSSLSQIVVSPYQGDWHSGVDIYKRWKDTWFHRPPSPAWIQSVNSWQTLQINSSEDDLRTPYRALPKRVAQAARNGISAIQLIGWNDGGQDRGNPSHDTDPRLGTQQELKDAIAESQNMGVRIVLFNKYTWADVTTDWYKQEVHNYMATDPYGTPYFFRGGPISDANAVTGHQCSKLRSCLPERCPLASDREI